MIPPVEKPMFPHLMKKRGETMPLQESLDKPNQPPYTAPCKNYTGSVDIIT